MFYNLDLASSTGNYVTSSFSDFNVTQIGHNIERKVVFLFEKLIEERGRIEWVILLVNLIFSSTFLTIFCIAIILSKDLQRIVFPLVAWVVWLIGSSIFLFIRLSIGLYHFLRITINLIAFVTMKAAAKAISAFQCAKYSFDKDPREQLLVDLENAQSYNEWLQCAQQLDKLSGALEWRLNPESDLYEWQGLEVQVSKLRAARMSRDITELMFLLRLSCSRTICGVSNPQLYTEALSGTKHLIEEFTNEVCEALELVCYADDEHRTPFLPDIDQPQSCDEALSECVSLEPDSSVDNDYSSRVISFSNMHPSFNYGYQEKMGTNINCSQIDQFPVNCRGISKPYIPSTESNASCTRLVHSASRMIYVRDEGVQTEQEIHVPESSSIGIPWRCLPRGEVTDFTKQKVDSTIKNDYSEGIVSSCNCSTVIPNSSPYSSGSNRSSIRPIDYQSEGDCHDYSIFSQAAFSNPPESSHQTSYLPPICSPSTSKHEKQFHNNPDYENPVPSFTLTSSRFGTTDFKMRERLKVLVTLRVSLGRTALCLSGGGALAMYHMGVVKTLLEHNCLPKVISGTSGGSIVAGIIAINTDKELLSDILRPDVVERYEGVRWFPPLSRQLQRFFFTGHMMDEGEFSATCKAYYGDLTFRDAFLKTGRLVSIVVTPTTRASGGEALILNHINTPDVFMWSAVTASCSLPGLLPPHELMVRGVDGTPTPYCPSGLKWMDGSITQDIPIRELARLFNVKQFIVSQVNPHHAPFVRVHSSGSPWMQSIENWLTLDIKNRYAKLAKFNMVPRIYGQDISSFWMLQVFEGHVTITPRASLIDWYRMVNQPSIEDMEDFILKGQQRLWPHLPRIIQLVKIEQTLRRCWSDLTRSIRSNSNSFNPIISPS